MKIRLKNQLESSTAAQQSKVECSNEFHPELFPKREMLLQLHVLVCKAYNTKSAFL